MAIRKLSQRIENHPLDPKAPRPQGRHGSGANVGPETQHSDESNWLISYADMMTLLCGFFIMLFSISQVEESKYEKVREELSKQFSGTFTPSQAATEAQAKAAASAQLLQSTQKILEELGVDKMAKATHQPYGVDIEFESTVFFDTLSAEVKIEGRTVLARVIDAIAKRQTEDKAQFRIVVEGHTDSRPVIGGAFPTNWELSGSRAARVVRFLVEKGFKSEKLTAIGLADTQPLAPSRLPSGEWDENALARNRRVVLRVLEPGIESLPLSKK